MVQPPCGKKGKARMVYVLGFLFSDDGERVVLVRKNRPAWQAGKLNGVGGGVEGMERPIDAMRREFFEETGVRVVDWREVGQMVDAQTGVWVLVFTATGNVDAVRTMTDEEIVICNRQMVQGASPADVLAGWWVLPHLRWLIPICLDTTTRGFVASTVKAEAPKREDAIPGATLKAHVPDRADAA